MENEREFDAWKNQDKQIELSKKIVDAVNKLTGGHEGNPILKFIDYDAHRYDYGLFTDPNNSVNWYKKKLADKERVTLDDVVMYHVMQAFNIGCHDPELFKQEANKVIQILNCIIHNMPEAL